jgi:putative endonuclease
MGGPARDSQARRRARGVGLEAEFFARVYLLFTGWRMVAASYIAPGGEIDIIARRGDMLAFVEVKARATQDAALLSIDARKQQRISRAARHWIGRNPRFANCNFRGDAILIAPWSLPRRIPGAFHLDL